MVTANVPFEKRLRQVVRRHNRLAHAGTSLKVTKDGLIVARPRIYQPKFPLKGLVLMIFAGFAFKGYVYSDMGAATYEAKLAALSEGSLFEKAGSWVMRPDPATVGAAKVFSMIR